MLPRWFAIENFLSSLMPPSPHLYYSNVFLLLSRSLCGVPYVALHFLWGFSSHFVHERPKFFFFFFFFIHTNPFFSLPPPLSA